MKNVCAITSAVWAYFMYDRNHAGIHYTMKKPDMDEVNF